jgi:hypothetical protein
MAAHFMFDGEAIFVPQRSQGKGVARRLAEFEQGGAGLFRRSESAGFDPRADD